MCYQHLKNACAVLWHNMQKLVDINSFITNFLKLLLLLLLLWEPVCNPHAAQETLGSAQQPSFLTKVAVASLSQDALASFNQ